MPQSDGIESTWHHFAQIALAVADAPYAYSIDPDHGVDSVEVTALFAEMG